MFYQWAKIPWSYIFKKKIHVWCKLNFGQPLVALFGLLGGSVHWLKSQGGSLLPVHFLVSHLGLLHKSLTLYPYITLHNVRTFTLNRPIHVLGPWKLRFFLPGMVVVCRCQIRQISYCESLVLKFYTKFIVTNTRKRFILKYRKINLTIQPNLTSGFIPAENSFSLVKVSPRCSLSSQFISTLTKAWVAHEFGITCIRVKVAT